MIKRFVVDISHDGKRLDAFLADQTSESRSYWQKQIRALYVFINGKNSTASSRLKSGDTVTLKLPPLRKVSSIDVPIIYQDDAVTVINKPSGLLTQQRSASESEFTVADFIKPFAVDLPEGERAGIVHRLDRMTSGVMITARTIAAQGYLKRQFAARRVKKLYLAVVEGKLKDSSFAIDMPISRNPRQPYKFRTDANGKPAYTACHTLSVNDDHSLLLVAPKTGRTHQIRVHLSTIGHPIVGDSVYAKNPQGTAMFLHSYQLRVRTEPRTTEKYFTAPIPRSMRHYTRGVDLEAAAKQEL